VPCGVRDDADRGCGGVATGEDAVAMLMAGANALEVGTATFATRERRGGSYGLSSTGCVAMTSPGYKI